MSPVTTIIKLKRKRSVPPTKETPRFHVGMLREQTAKKTFTMQVRNKYQALSNNTEEKDEAATEENIDRKWGKVVKAARKP